MRKMYWGLLIGLVIIFSGLEGCTRAPFIPEKDPTTPIVIVPVAPPQSTDKTYLALGDSYTIGEGVDASQRYPTQAAAILKSQGIIFSQVQYIAQTGWTTTNLAAAIASQKLLATYDIVTLLIGVNDQYQRHDTTGYRANFTSLLNTAVQLTGYKPKHVVVLSIPDYGVTPFGAGNPTIGIQIDQFNEINKSVTLAKDIAYIDITGISRMAANGTGLILGAGPHFTGTEYGLWAAPLAIQLAKVLK
jgi:lysophospholipase L1-like esterase